MLRQPQETNSGYTGSPAHLDRRATKSPSTAGAGAREGRLPGRRRSGQCVLALMLCPPSAPVPPGRGRRGPWPGLGVGAGGCGAGGEPACLAGQRGASEQGAVARCLGTHRDGKLVLGWHHSTRPCDFPAVASSLARDGTGALCTGPAWAGDWLCGRCEQHCPLDPLRGGRCSLDLPHPGKATSPAWLPAN